MTIRPPLLTQPSKFAVAAAAPAPAAAPVAAPITVPFVSLPITWPITAPITAPPITFFASLPVVDPRTRSTDADVTSASTLYVLPPKAMLRTAKPISMLSFAFSLLLSFVTSSTAVAPAGITAPLLPVIDSLSVAVKRSPTLFVFVQTFSADVKVMAVPDATEPTPPAVFFSPGVTVLPDGVRTGAAGSALGVAAGVDGRVVGRLGVRGRAGAGVLGAAAGCSAGTSLSCGCAALSAVAICRSRLSAESCASVLSALSPPLLHAAAASTMLSANGVPNRRIYCDISILRMWCRSSYNQG